MTNQGTALMGIGIAKGPDRAVEAAKKAISSPLLETSIDGAQGVLMNITGGSNLSLFEVQEAADLVASASDHELNMIFGSIINDNLKDEIMITVIATGFTDDDSPSLRASATPAKETLLQAKREEAAEQAVHREYSVQRQQQEEPVYEYERSYQGQEDSLDIPTFLRNRNRRR